MTGESMYPVLVIGHRHPDTDAICSALAYANFYHWQTGREAVPCYLDDLAPETAWLLNHVGLAAPRPIADVYLRVADVMETQVPILRPDQTLREAGQLMQLHEVRALPVVGGDGRLLGLIQRDTLDARYLDQLQLPHLDACAIIGMHWNVFCPAYVQVAIGGVLMTIFLVLRDVVSDDLPVFFQQQLVLQL